MTEPRPRIGLALSGGGFRATVFGLGCLRALHDRDLLRHVRVVSGISGGSLLAAMWAYGPNDFRAFERSVIELVMAGLQADLARRALSPLPLARNVAATAASLVTRGPRTATRTDSLVAALTARDFGSRHVDQVTHEDLHTVISATDMVTGNAVRFGSRASSCSPYGRITDDVRVGEAVAASAAFPPLLPALHRTYEFQQRNGTTTEKSVTMTDGGVYDNLGLSPLLPGRSPQHTSHVYGLDYLIAADAGRGRSNRTAARFAPGRLKQAFDITYGRTQDASRAQIHLAGASGHIRGFVHAYLGMDDRRLPVPMSDLVRRDQVANYPTNFAAMAPQALTAITVRGEQLTTTLLSFYCPELVGSAAKP